MSVRVSSLSADMSGQARKTNELCSRQNWQGRAELPAGVTNGRFVVLRRGEPQRGGARWPPTRCGGQGGLSPGRSLSLSFLSRDVGLFFLCPFQCRKG